MTRILSISILVLSLFFVIGCGSKKVPKGLSDQQLYESAVEEINAERGGFPWIFNGRDYDMIFSYLKEVQLRYTYSPYSTLAELRTADAYFQKGEYEQAAIEYEEFLKRHPGHEEAAYATYRLALSYFNDRSSPDRDPTNTRNALKWASTFVDKYPGSPLIPDAQKIIDTSKDDLARREIYIGNFYSKRKNYKAAANRYNVVVTDYYDTKRYQEAMYLLGRAYAKEDQYDLARQTLNKLVQEYPNEKYSGKASGLLNQIQNKSTPAPEQAPETPQEG